MRVRYMLGPVTIREDETDKLPAVGDEIRLKWAPLLPDNIEELFKVKYRLDPIPGFTLAIVGVEDT